MISELVAGYDWGSMFDGMGWKGRIAEGELGVGI